MSFNVMYTHILQLDKLNVSRERNLCTNDPVIIYFLVSYSVYITLLNCRTSCLCGAFYTHCLHKELLGSQSVSTEAINAGGLFCSAGWSMWICHISHFSHSQWTRWVKISNWNSKIKVEKIKFTVENFLNKVGNSNIKFQN